MISRYLRRISNIFQQSHSSFKRHNSELERESAYESERQVGLDRLNRNAINDPELRIDDLLVKHPYITHAVDIGSGAGWGSGAMSSRVSKVIAIEPSEAGIAIAKRVYMGEKFGNITWLHGFAESILPTLHLDQPTLFFTGCVLSHLRDAEVEKICTAVNKSAPAGSIFSFAECWGDESWHQLMWHVRTKSWWETQFPGWTLDFHGPQVPGEKYSKGIWGVKN